MQTVWLYFDDFSHPLYPHLNIGIQISEKRALLLSGIEPGFAAYKAPDIPMCQIAPLVLGDLLHLNFSGLILVAKLELSNFGQIHFAPAF